MSTVVMHNVVSVDGYIADDNDDELVLHQVLPKHIRLRLVEAVPAPGVTRLHYEVER